MRMSHYVVWCCFSVAGISGLCMAAAHQSSEAQEEPPQHTRPPVDTRTVAGKADVLRQLPKKFAKLVGVDLAKQRVTLHVNGDEAPTTWSINPDAEIKIHGWWGRLSQLNNGERLWVWFDVDRQKQPASILMLADELSEKDIHGTATPDDIEPLRIKQRDFLRSRWRKEGLPGSVSLLHKLGGEMEVILDHEAIRWGRHLKNGDRVTLPSQTPVNATVKHVRPWRERTLIRLVTDSGIDQADLSPGQRIQLIVPEPPVELQDSEWPTDVGRFKTKDERIEWFFASTYCTCRIDKDRCTGMFYTLASCNPNACGNPNRTRKVLTTLIDEGKSDREILATLRETRGPELLRPHLLK